MSCHEDYELFGYELLGDGETVLVCCKVYSWLEKKGLIP